MKTAMKTNITVGNAATRHAVVNHQVHRPHLMIWRIQMNSS